MKVHEMYVNIFFTRNNNGEIRSYKINTFSETSVLQTVCHICQVFILNYLKHLTTFLITLTMLSNRMYLYQNVYGSDW
jgi:hypothetical protein